MNAQAVIRERCSVRSYTKTWIAPEAREALGTRLLGLESLTGQGAAIFADGFEPAN